MSYISRNPYTEAIEHEYPDATDAQVEQALATAHSAFLDWSHTDHAQRAELLRAVGRLLTERTEELAAVLTRDMGKTIGEARAEVGTCVRILTWYADHAEKFLQPRTELAANYKGGTYQIVPSPLGIIFIVEPWNFPYYQIARVLAPQLAAGNTVILKHASNVPGAAQAWQTVMDDAGAPRGLFTNLFATHDQSARIIADPRVRGVALTGSEAAGAVIAGQAAQALKKSTMELGGADALIVLEDAEVEKAARWAAYGRHRNAGQVCVSSKRMIVVDAVYDRFVAAYLAEVGKLRAGDPFDPDTTLAPLSTEGARTDLQAQVERAVAAGATAQYVDLPVPEHGWFFPPVVLSDISPDNPAYHEEFFGPVTQLYRVADEDAAVKLANDSPYGLGGSVFTADEQRGLHVARRLDTGMVAVNRPSLGGPDVPFGGTKRSGYGRELIDLGLLEFVNQKVIGLGDIDA
ncbi:NAD-dependent succinate-semialdehyde dehydrogenase [Pseudoclavibacter sp. CFCC 13796]|uniref:NAD-dependent succinate-semialdehyde dehydrogenase n=1 Tax=Pseudoclavibacter sp. CFCC 13796 TaxID=2615179 RepID=UPI0013013E46|nr:NAD-dependent succinate-semialdehyde dehydrogenase [Pseudoclavibacter sp. CFCC 13796]KAB1660820.1 NAD-dependent succinate-semialdehyde dehydrogenase [Pseudoclavibacter sp. CFCC 13796]